MIECEKCKCKQFYAIFKIIAIIENNGEEVIVLDKDNEGIAMECLHCGQKYDVSYL